MEPGRATITLILGGARSGKSRYAEQLAARAKDVVYLATAEASDQEMRAKIERHRKERPAAWKTVEVPVELDAAIAQYGKNGSFLLVDCLTVFTANLMTVEGGDEQAILKRVDRLRSSLLSTSACVAMVSNEVGSSVVPEYPSGRQFRNLLGEINQIMAQISNHVILMIAGCPLVLKGAAQGRP